jgi:hypothetical protein
VGTKHFFNNILAKTFSNNNSPQNLLPYYETALSYMSKKVYVMSCALIYKELVSLRPGRVRKLTGGGENKLLGLYSKHFVFFITYKLVQ